MYTLGIELTIRGMNENVDKNRRTRFDDEYLDVEGAKPTTCNDIHYMPQNDI